MEPSDLLSILPADLLNQIVSGLDRASLAQLALVSHKLYEHATDGLYQELPTPFPLLRSLPVSSQASRNIVILAPPLAPAQFLRFHRLASPVRKVSWIEADETMHLASLVVASHQALSFSERDTLLPNVKEFQAVCDTAGGLNSILPWLSPSLECIELNLGRNVPDDIIVSCFTRIQSLRPKIKTFILTLDNVPLSQRSAVVEALASLAGTLLDLQRFSLPLDILSNSLLDALSTLPDLRQLEIMPPTSPLAPDTRFRRATPLAGQFPALRNIQICGFLSEGANIVEATTEYVEEVHISSMALQSADEMSRFLHAITYFLAKLTVLTINISHTHSLETPAWMDMRPLLTCASLEYFVITHVAPLNITNTDIEHMLQAWFLLSHLSLNPRPRHAQRVSFTGSLPTLRCLESVAVSGLCLKHFGVYMKPGNAVEEAQAIPLMRNDALRVLDLGKSDSAEVGSEYATAVLVRRLFPRAEVRKKMGSPWTKRVAWRSEFL